MKKDDILERLARLESLIPQLATKIELKQEINKLNYSRKASVSSIQTPNSSSPTIIKSFETQDTNSTNENELKQLKEEISKLEKSLFESESSKKTLILEKERLELENMKLSNLLKERTTSEFDKSHYETELSNKDFQLKDALIQRDKYKDLVKRLATELESVRDHVDGIQNALKHEKKINEKLLKEKKKKLKTTEK